MIVAAALISTAAAVTWVAQGAQPPPGPPPAGAAQTENVPAGPPPPPADASIPPTPTSAAGLVSYAIPTIDLQGLRPDIAPGTHLDLWVTWQPPVTKTAELHPLLKDVVLEEIVPPLSPDGPHAAILLVDPDQITDLMWGDRFGALSAAVPSAPKG